MLINQFLRFHSHQSKPVYSSLIRRLSFISKIVIMILFQLFSVNSYQFYRIGRFVLVFVRIGARK